MIIVIVFLIFVLIDYLVFDKKMREFEIILYKLDRRVNFIDEVKNNEVGDK